MSTTPETRDTPTDPQRNALNEAEKQAAEHQPGSFKDGDDATKIVDVKPIDGDSVPIQGLDPDL